MKTLKVGQLVRIKTKEEILKDKNTFIASDGDIYCRKNNDTIAELMFPFLGKMFTIIKVNKNIHKDYIGISYYLNTNPTDTDCEMSYNYYPSWITPINTKAAKLLFKGKNEKN